MPQYRVKPGVTFDADETTGADGVKTYLVHANDGQSEGMEVTAEQFETYFEEIPGDDAQAQDARVRVQAYEDEGGKWRWRKLAGNGSIVASSGESFSSRQHAERAAQATNPGVTLRTTLDEV